jgi:hypothetical protein
MRTSEFPTVILAAQGDIFKLIAADPQNAFLISAAQERATGQTNLLLGYLAVMGKNFSIASLDSLLGMEGNDVMDGSLYPPGTAYFPSNIDYWMKQLSSKQTVQEIQPFSENLSYLLQTVVVVISP